MDLPETFVMARNERAYRVPDTNGPRLQRQRDGQRRSGIVFIFSALCLVAYPGYVPLYTPPTRVLLPHEHDSPAP